MSVDILELLRVAKQTRDASPNWPTFADFVDSKFTPTEADFISTMKPDLVVKVLGEVVRLRELLDESTKIAAEWIALGIPDDDAQQASYRIGDIREAGLA